MLFHTAVLLVLLAAAAYAQDPISGKILTSRSNGQEKETIALLYRFDGKTLRLTHLGGFLNAGAIGTTGTISIKGKKITLKIRESYDKQGPADSIMRADVLYNVKGLNEGKYELHIDDSRTEGRSGILEFELILTKSKEEVLTAPLPTKPGKR